LSASSEKEGRRAAREKQRTDHLHSKDVLVDEVNSRKKRLETLSDLGSVDGEPLVSGLQGGLLLEGVAGFLLDQKREKFGSESRIKQER
jgi:hypothetical protein